MLSHCFLLFKKKESFYCFFLNPPKKIGYKELYKPMRGLTELSTIHVYRNAIQKDPNKINHQVISTF